MLPSRQASPPGPLVNGAVSCPVAHGLSHTQSTVPSVSLKPELSLALHWVVLGRCPLFSFIVYAPEGNCFAQSSGKQHFPPFYFYLFLQIIAAGQEDLYCHHLTLL